LPRKPDYIKINPEVLEWARESVGLQPVEVSKSLNISKNTVIAWELGNKTPSTSSLKKLASLYKRPMAALLLPSVPDEPPLPTDFRQLPNLQKHRLSKETRLSIRRARRYQRLAIELLEYESAELFDNVILGSATFQDNPELIAERERNRIGISVEDQWKLKDSYEALREWRRSLEKVNVLIFQTKFPLEEARGFSLGDRRIPVIVLNVSDSVNPRIFTIFHEYAHIMLGQPGICIPTEAPTKFEWHDQAEEFCDTFAGAFLVPKSSIIEDSIAQNIRKTSYIDEDAIKQLVNKYKVSQYVILRRLLTCNFITKDSYFNYLNNISIPVRKKPKWGPTAATKNIARNGILFTSLALSAVNHGYINYSDLSDYLDINLKYLDKVEKLVRQ